MISAVKNFFVRNLFSDCEKHKSLNRYHRDRWKYDKLKLRHGRDKEKTR